MFMLVMFLVFCGIDWLIKSLPSPKPVYLFFFWFQIIFCLVVVLISFKQKPDDKWGTKLYLIVALVCFYIFLFGSMFMDIPNLLLGQYESVEGRPEKVWHPRKSFMEHVNIGGKNVEFFMESKMREKENRQKYYHVEYLPHSKYVIDIKEIEK